MAVQNNLLPAALYLLTVPALRGIANLNEVHSAECLERSAVLIGIWIIVPLRAAEQGVVIRETVFARKIPQWVILLMRISMAMAALVLFTGIFAAIMTVNHCTFPYGSYVMGTVISEIALGSIGFLTAVLSDSVIAGYLVSAGYFLLNDLGNIPGTSVIYLFSMETGNFMKKVWLLGTSILMITITLYYVKKKDV